MTQSCQIKQRYIHFSCILRLLNNTCVKHNFKCTCRAHQTRRSGRNSRPISAEVALPRLQSEIKVALFLFASHSFLVNNLRFMVKLIVKTIVINGKIHVHTCKNKRKRFYSSNKEGLIC